MDHAWEPKEVRHLPCRYNYVPINHARCNLPIKLTFPHVGGLGL